MHFLAVHKVCLLWMCEKIKKKQAPTICFPGQSKLWNFTKSGALYNQNPNQKTLWLSKYNLNPWSDTPRVCLNAVFLDNNYVYESVRNITE